MSAKSSVPDANDDPVLAALERAPVGAPETDEEMNLVAAAKAGDRFVSAAEVGRMLALRARLEG